MLFTVVRSWLYSLYELANITLSYLLTYLCLYPVLLLGYSTSNNGVHLKQSGLAVIQGHWKIMYDFLFLRQFKYSSIVYHFT